MANSLNTLNFTFITRSAPNSGPTSSDAWNDSFNELATDLATISSEWNNKLVTVLDGLPKGEEDTSVNAFSTGLDGTTMWVDGSVTASNNDLTFYNSTKSRPATVEEAFTTLYQYVDNQLSQLSDSILDTATGLTTDQKNRIGANIFVSTQASSSTSLDGKSERNRLNIIQLASDLYGSGYVLGNDGSNQLTNSVFAMVDALLELHNGDWSSDITIDHAGAFSATQQDVNSSSPGDDSFTGSPTHLEDDLDQIRTRLKDISGTTGWLTTLPALYTGGANSIYDLLVSTSGSGTKSASNPWGYNYSDIDGLTTRLDAIRDFTGQSSHTDSLPSYTGTSYISNGDSLETAVGKLDTATATNSGIAAGKASSFTDLDDVPTTYSGNQGNILRVNSAETELEYVGFGHSQLSGLDLDGHTQYLLADGTRVLSGDFTVSGNITSSTTISGNVISTPTVQCEDLYSANNVTASGYIRSETTIEAGQDIEVTSSGRGLILTSPDGTRWQLKVDNAGDITTTAL